MEIWIVESKQELSIISAKFVAHTVRQKPNAVLGLATGSTPLGMYKELIQLHQEHSLDFSRVTTFNLDEYVGLSSNHPQSYYSYMYNHFFQHVNILSENIHIPRGDAPDPEWECKMYEVAITEEGQIDLQILGIGSNGHIGFNEPGSSPESVTRVVHLAESTIKANARFFTSIELVPCQSITMGMKTILINAKRILLLASGEEKAEAVKRMILGNLTPQLPASFLRTHPNVTVILDIEAAKQLRDVNKIPLSIVYM